MNIEEKKGALVITDFNEAEAYRIAVKIEKDGIRFYRKLAATAQKASVKETLEFLMNEETRHLGFFEESLERLRLTGEDSSEDDDLLSSMDFGIFSPYQEMEALDEAIPDLVKALKIGAIIEDKSIRFYQACRVQVSSPRSADELGEIIAEEERHKTLLLKLLKS